MADCGLFKDFRLTLSGSICALATPFDARGALDLDAFTRLIEYQLEGGTEALVVAGSTGEAHLLDDAELVQLLTHAVTQVRGRVPVLAGTGAASTRETIELTQRAQQLGIDAALVVTPYYVRPSQDGLRRHFLEVAEATAIPLILYNVPGRTACDMLPTTVAGLRDHPRIVGIKEAVPDHERITALVQLANESFVFLSGDDASAGAAMLAGASGAVSVVANVVPRMFRSLCDAARQGDTTKTASLDAKLAPLLAAMTCAPNPVPVKAGLAALEICTARVRAPLYEMEPGAEHARLVEALLGMV